MLTRSDYVLIAIVLCNMRKDESTAPNQGPGTRAAVATIDALARRLAVAFTEDNPHFNTPLFLTACGVPTGEGTDHG